MQITERAERAWILKGSTAINLSSCFPMSCMISQESNCTEVLTAGIQSNSKYLELTHCLSLKLDSHYIEVILHCSLLPVAIIPL